MSTELVTYDQAKAHLRLPDDREQAAVAEKVQQATALVLTHIGREENDWTDRNRSGGRSGLRDRPGRDPGDGGRSLALPRG